MFTDPTASVRVKGTSMDSFGGMVRSRRECLGLEHFAMVKRSLRDLRHGLSEYSFANLYLFRGKHEYEILLDEHIAIYGRTYDDHLYMMPLFDISKVSREYLVHLTEEMHFMFPIHEMQMQFCSRERFVASYNSDDSDYLHESCKFLTYPGNSLRGKKNLANRFSKTHMPWSRPLDDGSRDDAISVLEQWQEQVGTSPESTDYFPCLEALMLCESLELFGFVYYSDAKPCGFIIAEELAPEMCVLHFYKGERCFKGIYEYMFQHFACRYADRYRYFNFEQDLGMPGLNTAKSQYGPDRLLKKYRVKACE